MWCEGDELEIEKKEDKMTPKYVGRFLKLKYWEGEESMH